MGSGWHPALPGVAKWVGAHPDMATECTPPRLPFLLSVAKMLLPLGEGTLGHQALNPHQGENHHGALTSLWGHAGDASLAGPLILGLRHAHQWPQRAQADRIQEGRRAHLLYAQGMEAQCPADGLCCSLDSAGSMTCLAAHCQVTQSPRRIGMKSHLLQQPALT